MDIESVQICIQQKYDLTINHKAVLRLINQLGIHSIARRRKFLKKSESIGTFHCYYNVLNRAFLADRPNQKCLTDVTYIHTQQGWAFLSTIKDLHDGYIVAYHLAIQNSLGLVTNMLKLAKQKEVVTDGLVFHSDQGYQYSSQAYIDIQQGLFFSISLY